jgi:hypothetical protein
VGIGDVLSAFGAVRSASARRHDRAQRRKSKEGIVKLLPDVFYKIDDLLFVNFDTMTLRLVIKHDDPTNLKLRLDDGCWKHLDTDGRWWCVYEGCRGEELIRTQRKIDEAYKKWKKARQVKK